MTEQEMKVQDLKDKAAAWFAAGESGDWETFRAMISDDATITQHLATPVSHTPDGLTSWAAGMAAGGIQLRYLDPRRTAEGNTLVEQHVVELTGPSGTVVASDVCVVMHFGDDGLITQLDEYIDPAFAAALQ